MAIDTTRIVSDLLGRPEVSSSSFGGVFNLKAVFLIKKLDRVMKSFLYFQTKIS